LTGEKMWLARMFRRKTLELNEEKMAGFVQMFILQLLVVKTPASDPIRNRHFS